MVHLARLGICSGFGGAKTTLSTTDGTVKSVVGKYCTKYIYTKVQYGGMYGTLTTDY